MTSVEFHPEAERELFEVARYYEQQTPGLGEQFPIAHLHRRPDYWRRRL